MSYVLFIILPTRKRETGGSDFGDVSVQGQPSAHRRFRGS